MKIEIYDTTLRDGAQCPWLSFSLSDKLQIAQKLDEIGFHYIEGGWPGSNPKDERFFKEVKKIKLKNAQIVAFGMTCRKGRTPHKDSNLQKLLEAQTEIVTIFGKSWGLHVKEVLKATLRENLSLIRNTCLFLKSQGRRVFYDAEHFFDGFKADPGYALETLKAAVRGGAERIILCDTNGGTLPWEIRQIIRKVKKQIPVPLGIHAHNDSGLAVANSLTAVKQGMIQVQGTINGYGERCGNADLCTLIPNVQLKMGFLCLSEEKLTLLTGLSHWLGEISNLTPNPFQPYVGTAAFLHKGGIHVDAVKKSFRSYNHIDPALVGNSQNIAVSEVSGRSNILDAAKNFGYNLKKDSPEINIILKQIKELENQGFHFEGADASLKMLFRRLIGEYQPPFKLIDFKVCSRLREETHLSQAWIKLRVGKKVVENQAEGNGPVNALDRALRKVLLPVYPELKDIFLVDYKVRILEGNLGTGAKVRVLIEASDKQGHTFRSVGSSTNIIEASWQALADSFEYAILEKRNDSAGGNNL